VFAATQRRRFSSFVTIPLVVAIVPLLVAKLVALQRADVIAELADRATHGDSPEAIAAVRQLASIRGAPVTVLVSAATSADRDVAEEAKYCISRLLRRAQRQIEAGRRVAAVSRQLAELAESLDAQKEMFSAADYAWLSGTTHTVLRLANRIPPRHAPLVAVHCDAVLTGIAAKGVSTAGIAEHEPDVEQSLVGEGAMMEDAGESRQARLEMTGKSSDSARTLRGTGRIGLSGSVRMPAATSASMTAAPSTLPLEATVAADAASGERAGGEASAEASAEELWQAPWRASWSHPIFRMMPARPISAPTNKEDTDAEPTPPVNAVPAEQNASEPPLAELDSQELLRRWLDAEGADVFPLEQELTRRGFGRLSERLVQQFFSSVPQERLALVDTVLTEPGVDARPWLVLLSEDSDADVRLLAVTIMATSNDAALVDKAWQASIRDRDPRIAGLAGRLRERRETAQQR
jgi:hypothetical protein